ncbi:MAG: mannose-6-phosphate isomerase, class I [Actinomyces sp.]|nr:mannose-6-phosphate isomerase, class I [Actinomyces sp.]
MLTLSGAVQNYDWGSPTTIPDFLGVPADGNPWAEVWYGAHPSHPAMAASGARTAPARPLDSVIAADPEGWLGGDTVQRFGPGLPFLVKLLATRRALSIQVHPSLEQAREGFRREREQGLDVDHSNYSDANHKPEAIVALSPLRALAGFRHAEDIRADLALVAGMEQVCADLDTTCESQAIELAFTRVQHLSSADAGAALAALCAAPGTPALDLARELLRQFPGDRGALLSVFLNQVTVEPGHALSTGAGTVHAYLDGFGLEVMSSSDNVLRAGLTSKRVDIAEFCASADFCPGRAPVRSLDCSWPAPAVSLQELQTGVPDFHLGILEVREPARVEVGGDGRVTMLIALEGAPVLSDPTGRSALVPGEAVLVRATECVRVEGAGRLALVTVSSHGDGPGIRVSPLRRA